MTAHKGDEENMWFKKSNDQDMLIDKGMKYINQGKWTEAEKTFDQCILNNPENQDAHIGKVLSVTHNFTRLLTEYGRDIFACSQSIFDTLDYEFQNITLSKSQKGKHRDTFNENFTRYTRSIKQSIDDALTEMIEQKKESPYTMLVERVYEIPNRGVVVQGVFRGILPVPSKCQFVSQQPGDIHATAWITGVSLDKRLVSGLSSQHQLEVGRCEILLRKDSEAINEDNLMGTTLVEARMFKVFR